MCCPLAYWSAGRFIVSAAKLSLLLVDNVPYVLDPLARLLARDYDVVTADSADAAECVFHRQSVDIILTDQKMPKRSGIELLEWVRFHSPRTVRLVMTGHAELAATIDAINRGHVYHYLTKGWHEEELLLVLRNAAEKVVRERKIEELHEELRQVNSDLEARVLQRTQELEKANRELEKAYKELKRHDKEMKRLALTDPLTELHNRRMIESLAAAELRRHTRYHNPLSLGIIDVDHFKNINTKYELPGGDAILQGVAKLLTASIRETDAVGRLGDEEFLSVGRYGGEEFLVIAREATEDGAWKLGERIRKKVEGSPIAYKTEQVAITVSIGFAVAEGATPVTYKDMYEVAAAGLKQSKDTGRNRVVVRRITGDAVSGPAS
jgi:PleD family two-component response regulator